MMVGTSFASPQRHDRELGPVLLSVTGLSVPAADAFGTSLRDVSFDVRAGEILGIGGVAGNGQDELLSALSGEARTQHDMVQLSGKPIGQQGPNNRRLLGILSAPEERLGHAAAPNMSLVENAMMTAASRQELVSNGFLAWSKAKGFADRVISEFDVRTPSANNAARS